MVISFLPHLYEFAFLGAQIIRIIWYLFFSVWLISLCLNFSDSSLLEYESELHFSSRLTNIPWNINFVFLPIHWWIQDKRKDLHFLKLWLRKNTRILSMVTIFKVNFIFRAVLGSWPNWTEGVGTSESPQPPLPHSYNFPHY